MATTRPTIADLAREAEVSVSTVNRILAGADARQIDREAARLLGMDWQTIGHLSDRAF